VPEEHKILLEQLAEETKAKKAAAGPTQPVAPTLPAGTTGTSPQAPVNPLTPTSSSVVSTPSPLRHQAIPPSGAQPQPSTPSPLPPQPIASIAAPGSDPLRSSAPGFIPPMNPSSRPPFPHQQGPRPPRFQQSFVSDNSSGGERHHHRGNRDRNLDETPDFATKEEAEEAFKNLLKETVRFILGLFYGHASLGSAKPRESCERENTELDFFFLSFLYNVGCHINLDLGTDHARSCQQPNVPGT